LNEQKSKPKIKKPHKRASRAIVERTRNDGITIDAEQVPGADFFYLKRHGRRREAGG
jgi:hypothetical protein